MIVREAAQDMQPNFKIGYGDYLRFRDLVLERSGLHFPDKRRCDLEAGLLKVLAESPLVSTNGGYDLDGYYRLLCDRNNQTGRGGLERLINKLTVGETHFFRNKAQFDALSTHILPALIARKRAAAAAIGPDNQPQLRIWSAGCATGEEPYSLAIMLKELLPDIDKWHILILATDINQAALARAQEALYSDWSFREPRIKALQPRYFSFVPTIKRYRLRADIRQMVAFAPLNLIEDSYPAVHNNTVGLDLILCRNVTIYFTEADTQRVVRRFHESLFEGGWLVVGHSEPSLVVYRAFQARLFSKALFYQKTGQNTPWPDDRTWLDNADSAEPLQAVVNWPVPASAPPVVAGTGVASPNGALLSSMSLSPASPLPVPDVRQSFGKDLDEGRNRTSGLPWATQAAAPSKVDAYELAGILLNEGHIEEAIDALHGKLIGTPNFAPAHSLLGRAYANLGHWPEARRWCESALNLDSLLAEAYYVLALIHEHENEIRPAIDVLKKAIYLEPDVPLFHFNLAVIYKKADQIKMARRSCRNVIRILEKWPPAGIVPDTGGATAKHLLEAARRIQNELEIQNKHR
jgi:chemotaxis protein methyltransferase CheR